MKRLDYCAAAAHLGIKLSTLRSLVSRGQIPHIRLTARLVVFDLDALERHLDAKRVEVGGVQ